MRVGPYHRMFANGETLAEVVADATAEADLFISMVEQGGGVGPGDLRPALDVETPFGGLNATELRAWIGTWTERVEAALGAKPVIYTNNSSWQATGNTTDFAARRPSALGRPLGRPRAARPGELVGRQQLVGVAVLELGPRQGHHRPRRPQPARRPAATARSRSPERAFGDAKISMREERDPAASAACDPGPGFRGLIGASC